MERRFAFLLFLFFLGILIYFLLRLRRWEKTVRGYKWKNQEGVGTWSRSRNPLFLFIAGVQTIYFLSDWLLGGFQWQDLYLVFLTIGLPLYLYFANND